MKRILAILALAALLVSAPAMADQTEIRTPVSLKEHVVVQGDVVHLGDIFYGLEERADTAIARAPEPGAKVELNARWLQALAQGYDLPWRPSSRLARVVVERASHVIDADLISALVADRIADGERRGDISVVLDNPAVRLHLPADLEPSLTLVGFAHDAGSGRFRAQVGAPADSPSVQTFVSGRAIEMREVPVLRRNVAPGETIRQQDVTWARVRGDRLARNVVTAAEELVGKSPRRPVSVQQPLRADELRDPVVVAKNSLVLVKLKTDRMQLTAQGRALEDGIQGGVIRVMNTKSNVVINAVVVDSGTVQVPSAGRPATE